MAITPTDFEKIWSTNASTPEYTFDDADYLEGWDFVGNLPPTRAQWNAIQKRTDEKMKYVFDNFGAPLLANTVAEMTLQNRVYVYTGSEVGYTAGHWYYYDGNDWVDGGVYNALAVQTDTTLSIAGEPADAKQVGGIFENSFISKNDASLLTVGAINTASGNSTTSTSRMRTGYFDNNNIDGFKVASGYEYEIFAYNGTTYVGVWNGSTFAKTYFWFVANQNVVIFPKQYNSVYRYRVMVRRTDNADIDLVTDYLGITFINTTDNTLSVANKSADAKATGNAIAENRNVLSNYALSRKTFVHEAGSGFAPADNKIYINIPQDTYFETTLTLTPAFSGNTRIYTYYADGTTAYNTTTKLKTTASKDIVAFGVYTASLTNDTTALLQVAHGLGLRLLDLPTYQNEIGIYAKSFDIPSGSSHSASDDKIYVDIPQGENVLVNVGFDQDIANTVQIYATYKDGTNQYWSTRSKDMVASKDISAISIYVTTVSQDVTATVDVFYGLGYAVAKLSDESANNDFVTISGVQFTIPSGSSHSSNKDRIYVNIPAGTMFTVDIQSSKTVNQIYVFYTDGTSDSLGQNKNFRTAKADKDIDSIGLYFTTASADVDVHACVYYGQLVDQTTALFNSDKAKTFASLFNGCSICDTFFFFSDPHYLQRHYMSFQQIAYIRRNLETMRAYASELYPAMILCGGDMLNDSDTQAEACLKLRQHTGLMHNYLGEYNAHTILGNHDTNYQGDVTLAQDVIDNLMFFNEDTKKAYFTYQTSQTNYLCLDTGSDHATSMTTYRWEQMDWLANKLLSNTTDYVIVCMHIFSNKAGADFGTDNLPMSVNTVSVITAFNNRTTLTLNGETYDFTGAVGTVKCILCGHVHDDVVYTATDNLPVIAIDDATSIGTKDIKFDMGFLDYDNDTLYMFRVNGAETDRVITLR